MKKYHTDKNGNKKLISELETDHLRNILNLLEKRAKEGITIERCGGVSPEDFWFDTCKLKGQEALKEMGYQSYLDEYNKRTDKTVLNPIKCTLREFLQIFSNSYKNINGDVYFKFHCKQLYIWYKCPEDLEKSLEFPWLTSDEKVGVYYYNIADNIVELELNTEHEYYVSFKITDQPIRNDVIYKFNVNENSKLIEV